MTLRALLIVLIFSSSAFADDNYQPDEIDRLFKAMNQEAAVEQMWGQMSEIFKQTTKELNITADEQDIFDRHNQRLLLLLKTEMSWEKMKQETRLIYTQNFTTDEIRQLADFYESPVGQTFVERMPVVMQESMAIGQRMAMQTMPKMQEITQQLYSELKEMREKASQE